MSSTRHNMQHVEWAAVNSFTRSRERGGRTAIFFLFRAATEKNFSCFLPPLLDAVSSSLSPRPRDGIARQNLDVEHKKRKAAACER